MPTHARLGLLNLLVLQWFFVRVACKSQDGKVESYGIVGPVLPLTGWGSVDFIPSRPDYLEIWRV